MLHFFRKYQKYIFLFVIIVTITTFVFFGTYQAFVPKNGGSSDTTAFVTPSGKKIKKLFLEQLGHFLAEEGNFEEGGNFLNDGVVTKDFFESDLVQLLFEHYKDKIGGDLQSLYPREKAFVSYSHPHAPFIAADKVWSVFAQDLNENLIKFKNLGSGSTVEAFKTKMALYLSEKHFPPELLAQVLRHQEKEYQIPQDIKLYRGDLSLFGYKDLKDWFGPRFIEIVSAIVLNGADLAYQKGYRVSYDEAYADLLQRNEAVFQRVKEEIDIPNSRLFLHRFLQYKGFDEKMVVEIWQNVLLFRRLFTENALTDTLALSKFYAKAHECFEVELTELDDEVRFQTKEELQKFENYLAQVAGSRATLLDVPLDFDPVQEVEKRAPSLVGKHYELEIATIEKKEVALKVSLREMWEWQTKHFEAIRKEFPGVAFSQVQTREEIEKELESLDSKLKQSINTFTKNQIVDANPHWIEEALAVKPKQSCQVLLGDFGKKFPLPGISDPKAFLALLESQEDIASYTQDNSHFYSIHVKARADTKQVLSFKQASDLELLDSLSSVDCKPLFRLIYEEGRKAKWITEEIPESEFENQLIPYRFAAALRKNRDSSKILPLTKRVEKVNRASTGLINYVEGEKLAKDEVSEVYVSLLQGPYYFKMGERHIDTSFPLDKWFEAKEILGLEIKKHLIQEILQKMDKPKTQVKSKSICLTES